ncbi:single-stranded DNA-binding protein [Candidatus Collierbacteria bacterium]|nr:single-stranded DNA-binding protein [Candidatus Collierbacteria bacterium]
MSSRSLNKVLLIGNLTVDPELRYTPQGTAVATFSVATNRNWTDQSGQPQEAVEFTRCVAWAKLAEVCSQILKKGKKVYVEGRLQTREWEAQDKTKRRTTEVIIESMIALSPAGAPASAGAVVAPVPSAPKQSKKKEIKPEAEEESVAAEDIPF